MLAPWPDLKAFDKKIITDTLQIFEVVTQIRNIRASKGISPKAPLKLIVNTLNKDLYSNFEGILMKLANTEPIQFGDKVENAVNFVIHSDEFFVPLEGKIDLDQERENLEKEIDYTRGFLASISKKLENEKFVNHAPVEVVDREKKKKDDAQARLTTLNESLRKLGLQN